MSWEEGKQGILRPKIRNNQELLDIAGHIEEKEAKIALYEFLRGNMTFATELLMGIQLFPFQHMAINSIFASDYTLGVWSRGLSKSFSTAIYAGLEAALTQGIKIGIFSASFRQCLVGDTLVLTETGLKRLDSIKEGERIFAKDGLQKIKAKWKNPNSKGLSLKTKRGYSISGKKKHRVLTYDSDNLIFHYKELKDLKKGDIIPISCNTKSEGKKILSDFFPSEGKHGLVKPLVNLEDCDDFYYLLGQFVGDGHFRKDKSGTFRFSLTSSDDEILNHLKTYLESLLPSTSVTIRDKERVGTKSLDFSSAAMGEVFTYMGYEPNKTAIDKTIPNKIFSAKKEYIASFIRGLMDSDGCCYKEGGVGFNTSSKIMAKEFQSLLLTFGIISSFSEEKAKGEMYICGTPCIGRESYKVRVFNYYNVNLYNEKIGFKLKRKAEKLQNYLNGCKRTTNQFVIPKLGDTIKEKYKGGAKWGVRKSNFKGNINKYSAQKMLDMGFLNPEDNKLVKDIVDSDFYFDEVKEIKEEKRIETYDIEVENEHCYWGNGFINHNSKQIFTYIEEIASKPEAVLFKQCITGVSKRTDEWEMKIGKSVIKALPLGSGEKLRGFRFQRIIIDEFLLMPEKIFNEVIGPFLSNVSNPTERQNLHEVENMLIKQGKMTEEERYIWPNNKLIALSSASYKFEYLYKLYTQYEHLITHENKQDKARRCIIHLSYDCAPSELYDKNLLNQSKATMSSDQFDREFGARFTDESDGYFKISQMNACTVPIGELPCVEIQGAPEAKYVLAFDPSWSQEEKSDNFAIQLLKLHEESQKATLVHSYALAGTNLKHHINYFMYCLEHFNVVAICGDYNGGVQFLQSCNESDIFVKKNFKLQTIEVPFDNPEDYYKDLRKYKREYNATENKIVFLRKPSSKWIRQANELLQGAITHKRIFFAASAIDDEYHKQAGKKIPIKELKFLRDSESKNLHWTEDAQKKVDFIDHQGEMMEKTKNECALIQPTQTAQGTQTFDLPANLRRSTSPDKARKDSYSALVLANWMSKIYFDAQNKELDNVVTSFTPTFIN